MKLSVAIIGSGIFADYHALYLKMNHRVNLSWIFGRLADKSEALAHKHGTKSTIVLSDVLDDASVQAVVVATPPWTHYEITLAALRAGKHVLSEKPLGLTPEQADALVQEAELRGLMLADCSSRHARLNPKFRMIRNLVSQQKFGHVYFIKYTYRARKDRYGLEYHPDAKWALDKSKAGGGPASEWGVYDLSFIYGLFDDQLTMQDAAAFGFRGVDDIDTSPYVFDTEEHLGSLLRFKEGLTIIWEVSTANHGEAQSKIELFGSRAGLSGGPLTWDSPNLMLHKDGPNGPVDIPLIVPELELHENDLPLVDNDFVDPIFDGKAHAMSGRNVTAILRTIDAVYRSARLRP